MKSHADVTSWVMIFMAATSLLLMICLQQIDNIVHGTLYSYGLQFSYDWAGPYWKLSQIGFTLGWLNIAVAFAVQLYNIRIKRKSERPTTAIDKAWDTWKTQEDSNQERNETEPTKPPDEAPTTTSMPEEQEKKKEPQVPETDQNEIPVLTDT